MKKCGTCGLIPPIKGQEDCRKCRDRKADIDALLEGLVEKVDIDKKCPECGADEHTMCTCFVR